MLNIPLKDAEPEPRARVLYQVPTRRFGIFLTLPGFTDSWDLGVFVLIILPTLPTKFILRVPLAFPHDGNKTIF